MPDINLQISRIEELMNQLVTSHSQLIQENIGLQAKLRELEGELRGKNSELALLEVELKNARVAQGIRGSEHESDLAKAKISSLVREIDRCIALLNE